MQLNFSMGNVIMEFVPAMAKGRIEESYGMARTQTILLYSREYRYVSQPGTGSKSGTSGMNPQYLEYGDPTSGTSGPALDRLHRQERYLQFRLRNRRNC